jgi:hypothetical protein
MATLAQIRTKVRDRAGIDAANPLFTDTLLTALINASLAEVSTLADWYWLYATQNIALVAGQATYAPSSTVTRIRYASFVDSDGDTHPLDAYRLQDFAHLDDSTGGCPEAFAVEGSTIHVAPKPVAADLPATLRLGVVIPEPVLVADGDTPLLPDHYVDLALVACAAHKAAVRSQNNDMIVALTAEKVTAWEVMRDQARLHLAAPRVQIGREWPSSTRRRAYRTGT